MKKYVMILFFSFCIFNLLAETIVAAVPRHYPPYFETSPANTPVGFAIDIFDEIADRADLKVKYIIKDNWADTQEALASGEADIIPNISVTPERSKLFIFSHPLATFVTCVFTRSDNTSIVVPGDLLKCSLGVVKTNSMAEKFLREEDMHIVVYDSVQQAMFELLAGKIDAVAYPQDIFLHVAREVGVENRLKSIFNLEELKRAIAINPAKSYLLYPINKALEEIIQDKTYDQIYHKWYGQTKPFWTTFTVWIAIIIALFLSGISVGLWRQKALKRLNNHLRKNLEELQATKNALSVKDTWLSTIMENAFTVVTVLDENGKIAYINKKGAALFHQEPKGIYGQKFDNLYKTEIASASLERTKEVKTTGKSLQYTDLVALPTGKKWFYSEYAGLGLDDNGNFLTMIVSVDITERVRAEEEILKEKNLTRNYLDSAPILFLVINYKYEVTFCNKEATNFFLWEKNQTPVFSVYLDQAGNTALQSVFEQETAPLSFVSKYHLKNSTIRWNAFPVQTNDRVTEIILAGINITNLKEAENKATRLHNLLSSIFKTIPEKLFVVDTSYNVIFARDLLAESMPRRVEKCYKYFMGQDEPCFFCHLKETLTTGKNQLFEHYFPQQKTFWEIRNYPIVEEENKTMLMVEHIHNITNRKKVENFVVETKLLAERSLRLASLGTMAGGIAHEINQPLTVIKAEIDSLIDWLAQNNELSKEELQETLKIIHAETERAVEIISYMRNLIRSNPEVTNLREISLNLTIQEALSHFKQQIKNHGILLKYDLCQEDILLKSNKTSFEQIIINIVSNAIFALDENGEEEKIIIIRTFIQDDKVIIEICNNGQKIPENVLPFVFDPFFTTKQKQKSMGLGLSLVENFVSSLNGKIRVENTEPTGVLFKIELPHYPV